MELKININKLILVFGVLSIFSNLFAQQGKSKSMEIDSWLPIKAAKETFQIKGDLSSRLESFSVSLRPVVCKYNENIISEIRSFSGKSDDASLESETSHWRFNLKDEPLQGDHTCKNLELNFRIIKGNEKSASVAVAFDFEKWSTENYVFVPAAAYNGNRFKSLQLNYPPFLFDKKYHRPDLPIHITDVPRLNIEEGPSRMELLTTSAATPVVGVYNPNLKKGFFLYIKDRTRVGISGLILEESLDRKRATLVVSAPGVRKLRYSGMHLSESNDKGIDWKAGDSLNLQINMYIFEAENLQVFFKKFFKTRKVMSGSNEYVNVTPYSAALQLQVKLQNELRWFESGNYYKNGNGDVPHAHIQIGWVGGLMQPYPLIASGDELSFQRSLKTINTILTKMQGTSGLFYGIYKDGVLYGDNFTEREEKPEIAMIRKNGDALYYVLKEFMLLKEIGRENEIKPEWKKSIKLWADGLVSLWKEYGQFGQLVNVETGKIYIGGSTAGASIPAALALASEYFNEPDYLKVAEESAMFYYNRDVKQGYTTGGPGEILQNPDSETAFAMLESFMMLYELTGKEEWLKCTKDMAHLASSWVVSYDFEFPGNSTLGKAGAKSAGAVWASTQNKHAAPGICTWSGDSLLKLYRATGDVAYLELLRDIAHNILGYMSTSKRGVGCNNDGYICERVNISDWEGAAGYVGPWANSWAEMAVMMTTVEIPGIYIRPDDGFLYVFDHVNAEVTKKDETSVWIKITNPTKYDAEIDVFSETVEEMNKPLDHNIYLKNQKVVLSSGETQTVFFPVVR